MKIVPDQFVQDWYRWLGKVVAQTKLHRTFYLTAF